MTDIHDETLDKNEALRQRIINKMTEGSLPTSDPDALFAIKSFLDASDRSSLARMKLKQDKEVNDDAKRTTLLIAEALKRATARSLSVVDNRSLDHDIPLANPVDGEMEIGNVSETWDDFMASSNG